MTVRRSLPLALAALAALLLVGCHGDADPSPSAALDGTCWQLVEIQSLLAPARSPEAGCDLVICFDGASRWHSERGCNQCSGSLVATPTGGVEILGSACTERACFMPCTPDGPTVFQARSDATLHGRRLVVTPFTDPGGPDEWYLFERLP